MSESRSPFAVLGLTPTATVAQVKAAYRRRSRKLHPDVGGDEEAFRELTDAFREASAYAAGERPNPYAAPPRVQPYDRHLHSPPPPPNPWRNGVLGGSLFWVLPVLAGIFMISSSTGTYFLPVFAAGVALLAVAVALVARRKGAGRQIR